MNMNTVPAAFSIPEAAKYTSLSRSTLYRLMDAGELPFIKIGARRLITRNACDALLEAGANPDAQNAA